MTDKPRFARLDRTVLLLEGPDVRSLLQGIITTDAAKLTPETPQYALLLSPQGKYLFDFFLTDRGNDTIWMDTAALRAEELLKKLTLYRLRSQVKLAALPGVAVYAVWGQGVKGEDGLSIITDPRCAALGCRVSGAADEAAAALKRQGFAEVDQAAYHMLRIQHVVPEGEEELTAEKSFPLEYGLDALGAIDFHKGCYVGQEVTARTKHRGVIRKRLYRVESPAGGLTDGAPVLAGDAEIGEIRSAVGPHGLALLRMEELEAALAAQKPIQSAGRPLKVHGVEGQRAAS